MVKAAKKSEEKAPSANIYYSPGKRGFYNDLVHKKSQIPKDAIAITQEHYDVLLAEQSKGKSIGVDEFNRPVSADPVLSLRDKALVLKGLRKQKESAGFKYGSVTFPSDEKTEMRLTAAASIASADPSYAIKNWTTDGGKTFSDIDGATINEILAKMARHHAACFAAEALVANELGSLETREAISAAFEKAYSKSI
jgi:hypothetical protein